MGQKDLTLKSLMMQPDVAADVINVLVHGGERRVRPTDLQVTSTAEQVVDEGSKLQGLERDICMRHVKNGKLYRIYGIENQDNDDLTMPVRVMGYDYAAYEKQIEALRRENKRTGKKAYVKQLLPGQKLKPVTTLVVYYGAKPSKMPRDLREMVEFAEGEEETGFANYPMRLVSLGEMAPEEIKKFESDFRHIAKFVHAKYTKSEDFRERIRGDAHMDHVKETAMALAALAKDRRYLNMADQEGEEKMCEYLDYLEAKGKAEGKAEGKESMAFINYTL